MWISALERCLNVVLARDPAASTRLSRLAGTRLRLRVTRPRYDLTLSFSADGVALMHGLPANDRSGDIDVELDERTMRELLTGHSIEQLMFNGHMRVRGSVMRLEAIRDLFLDMDLDWEGALATWLGDTPAHGLAESLRYVMRFEHRIRRELSADLRDYVFEEARLLPGRAQAEVVRDHLTELDTTLDRLDARIARLQRRMDQRRRVA
ncbi:ubiquinone biosynthesis accessory factor UbiJ [Aidingimonas halophila]|uniref:Ubiquinone biosynthesis accessory factor UbiJ n=1 Tax=Aidingimonas halophila TaxID=574349 RepID=A0A1H2VFS2_9GAMM|nr:SCP2 sterol-binding domain-containing protein [Aidingimonas halophila]GHC24228.1 hypothetical protein GCM10008094_14040 [Aidingimonas halophila]SDW67080.1 ubiquinone biosynthesis protein UbiJ [Aidingimonas halophila]